MAAWDLTVPRAISDRIVLKALRDSGREATAVPEESIEQGAQRLRENESFDAA